MWLAHVLRDVQYAVDAGEPRFAPALRRLLCWAVVNRLRIFPRRSTGIAHLGRLQEAVEDPQGGLPPLVRDIGRIYLGQIDGHSEKIAELERTLRTEAAQGETTARLQTMPGIGPIGAMAIEAFAPPMESFRRGRDFAA